MTSLVPRPADSRLPAYLAAAYAALLLHASLYPWAGWRDPGVPWLAFLAAGWPRQQTTFDLATNLFAYFPLGFLLTASSRRRAPMVALAVGILLPSGLSLFIETTQNFLPSRVPSLADWLMNSLGAAAGAAVALRWGRWVGGDGWLRSLRQGHGLPARCGDIGILLLLLWLLAQLAVDQYLFGNGQLRSWFALPSPLPFAPHRFPYYEMALVASQTLAILIIAGLLTSRWPLRGPLTVLGVALLVKSVGLGVLMPSANALSWATAGALGGLALGLVLWLPSLFAAAPLRQAIAASALLLATAIANLMPDNPYHRETLRLWSQGPFFNFNGLARFVAAIWPYLAMPWLILCRKNHDA